MALPGGYKKNVNTIISRSNIEYPYKMQSGAAENMKDRIIENDVNLPQGVLHIDLDGGFKRFIDNDLSLTLDGERVPVIMMGIQKWAEFSATWAFTDEYKNIKIPFITIVRNPDAKPGTHPSLHYNIPQGKNFTYAEVPTWDGNRKGMDIYKIPQPIPVDLLYEVRIFAYRQNDLNKFNTKILKAFQARQAYTNVNGHYIPIVLDESSDESHTDDISQKRFYVQLYKFNLQGFIIDPADFEVVPAVNRVNITFQEKSIISE